MNKHQIHNLAALAVSALKYVAYAGVMVCAVGLSCAVQQSYPLWLHSIETEGVVSGYKSVAWQSHGVFGGASASSTSANLPVITFQDQNGVRFTFIGNLGHSRLQAVGGTVAVIYEEDNPSNAIEDRGLENWMAIYIWLFGFTASVFGVLRFRKV
jgi:hypothetical protein